MAARYRSIRIGVAVQRGRSGGDAGGQRRCSGERIRLPEPGVVTGVRIRRGLPRAREGAPGWNLGRLQRGRTREAASVQSSGIASPRRSAARRAGCRAPGRSRRHPRCR